MSTSVLDPEHTLAGYDRWSAGYDAHDNPMVAASEVALDRRPLEVAGRDVVELGCGTGRNLARILAGGARRYLGLDGSPGMLEQARRRGDDPRVSWALADLAAPLPLPDASADLVLIVLVLEHLTAIGRLLGEVGRVLRPGGALRIVDIHPGLVAGGTVAHFAVDDGEVRFSSTAHDLAALRHALDAAGLGPALITEVIAEDDLVAVVPRLAKHAGRAVLVDVAAVTRT